MINVLRLGVGTGQPCPGSTRGLGQKIHDPTRPGSRNPQISLYKVRLTRLFDPGRVMKISDPGRIFFYPRPPLVPSISRHRVASRHRGGQRLLRAGAAGVHAGGVLLPGLLLQRGEQARSPTRLAHVAPDLFVRFQACSVYVMNKRAIEIFQKTCFCHLTDDMSAGHTGCDTESKPHNGAHI